MEVLSYVDEEVDSINPVYDGVSEDVYVIRRRNEET